MGCCASSEKSSKGYRTGDYTESHPSHVGGGGVHADHEEIARRRMDYYNRDEVKKKQIIRNFD
jgi:hypothetical protein